MVALGIAQRCDDVGARSIVWSPSGPAATFTKEQNLPHRTFDPRIAMNGGRLASIRENLFFASRLAPFRSDVAHVHCIYYYAALRYAFSVTRMSRVVHVHLDHPISAMRWAFQKPPEFIITCARFLEAHVRDALPKRSSSRVRVEALPNAIDLERFAPLVKCETDGDPPPSSHRRVMLVVANLAPHKGQEAAIRTTKELIRRGKNVECWLAGEDRENNGYEQLLRNLVQELAMDDRVRFLGFRSDIPELFHGADVVLLPSTQEGLPLTILEAQASKTPVVAAPTAGIPEVVHDGETGFLVPAGDIAGYANRVELLIDRPDVEQRITEQAYAQVSRNHNWDTFFDRLMVLYGELSPPRLIRRLRTAV